MAFYTLERTRPRSINVLGGSRRGLGEFDYARAAQISSYRDVVSTPYLPSRAESAAASGEAGVAGGFDVKNVALLVGGAVAGYLILKVLV